MPSYGLIKDPRQRRSIYPFGQVAPAGPFNEAPVRYSFNQGPQPRAGGGNEPYVQFRNFDEQGRQYLIPRPYVQPTPQRQAAQTGLSPADQAALQARGVVSARDPNVESYMKQLEAQRQAKPAMPAMPGYGNQAEFESYRQYQDSLKAGQSLGAGTGYNARKPMSPFLQTVTSLIGSMDAEGQSAYLSGIFDKMQARLSRYQYALARGRQLSPEQMSMYNTLMTNVRDLEEYTSNQSAFGPGRNQGIYGVQSNTSYRIPYA